MTCPQCGSSALERVEGYKALMTCKACAFRFWPSAPRLTEAEIESNKLHYLTRVLKGDVSGNGIDTVPGQPVIPSPNIPRRPVFDDHGKIIS